MVASAYQNALKLMASAKDLSDRRQSIMIEVEKNLEVVRRHCKHENVGECGQIGKSYFSSRLCLQCGVWEHENGTGWHILTTRHPRRYDSRRELDQVVEFPTVVWQWCYGLGGHELPSHPTVKLVGTRCMECFAAIWLVEQQGLGRCLGCNARISPAYNHCSKCRPKRRKVRQLDLGDAKICAVCHGTSHLWHSYDDGMGGGCWVDCSTCNRTGVIWTDEQRRKLAARGR